MAKTLYIGDEMKVLFGSRDFFDLVEYYMGQDAVRHIEAMISADNATQAEHERELKEAYDEGAADAWSHQDYEAYENGKEDGYEEGYDAGYAEGYAEGFKAGYKKHNPWA